MNIFQILLASNSDAANHLAEAMVRLSSLFPLEIRFSEILESFAVNRFGIVNKNNTYLNALCQAHTEWPLEKVQSRLKEMEADMGRKRGFEPKEMVAIDLDLVLWNGEILRPWDVAQSYYHNCLRSLNQ